MQIVLIINFEVLLWIHLFIKFNFSNNFLFRGFIISILKVSDSFQLKFQLYVILLNLSYYHLIIANQFSLIIFATIIILIH